MATPRPEELLHRIEQLEVLVKTMDRELDMTADLAWSHGVLLGHLRRLIPADQAWEAAQAIQGELEDVPPAQRQSLGGQILEMTRRELLQKAVVRPPEK